MFWRFIPLTATITYRRRRCYNASVLQAERLIQAGGVRRSKYLSNWWEQNQLLILLSKTTPSHGHPAPTSSPLARRYWRRTARSRKKEEHHNAAHARRATMRWRAPHAWSVRTITCFSECMYDINLCTVKGRGSGFFASLHYIISLTLKTSEIEKHSKANSSSIG